MPKKRYGMYLRKSREDIEAEKIGHFETLARHEKQLWRFAEQLGIADCIAEEDIHRELVSGDSLAEREECRKLLRKVSDGFLAGVLAVDIDRISRGDMVDQGTISSVFRYSQTPILTPGKIYDPENDYDMQFMEMRLMFSRIEYETIKKRMQEGKIRSVMEGQYVGPYAPFGFEKCVVNRKKTLRFSEYADVNRWMYRAIADWSDNPSGIAHKLNEQGILTRKGCLWGYTDVVAVIQNVACKGYVSYRVMVTETVLDGSLRKRKKLKRNDEPIIVEGLHEGTVSEELWERANEMLRRNRKTRTRNDRKLQNPLAGLVVCSKCGKPLQRRKHNKSGGVVARLMHPVHTLDGCWMKSQRIEVVINAVIDALSEIAGDLEARDGDRSRTSNLALQRDGMLKRLDALNGAVDNLFRLAEFGRITDEEFSRRKASIEQDMAKTRESIGEIESLLENDANNEGRVIKIRDAIESLRDSDDAEKANRALKMIVKRIEYTNEGERDARASSGRPKLRIILR